MLGGGVWTETGGVKEGPVKTRRTARSRKQCLSPRGGILRQHEAGTFSFP